MQLKDPNLHLKLQEMCDCYLDTDFASELARMASGPGRDPEDNAVKYLALAIMYGITEKSRRLKLKRESDGTIKVSLAGEEQIDLPTPAAELFDGMIQTVRSIFHFDEAGGELPLALGLRTGGIDLKIKLKEREGKSSLKIYFPEW